MALPPAYTIHMMRAKNATNQFSDPVPLGFRWVVRDIHITYLGVSPTAVTLSLRTHELDYTIVGPVFDLLGPRTFVDAGVDVVLEEEERLHLTTSSEGVDCIVSGYQLSVV